MASALDLIRKYTRQSKDCSQVMKSRSQDSTTGTTDRTCTSHDAQNNTDIKRKEDFLSGKSSQTADKVFGRKPKGFSLFMRENICCEE